MCRRCNAIRIRVWTHIDLAGADSFLIKVICLGEPRLESLLVSFGLFYRARVPASFLDSDTKRVILTIFLIFIQVEKNAGAYARLYSGISRAIVMSQEPRGKLDKEPPTLEIPLPARLVQRIAEGDTDAEAEMIAQYGKGLLLMLRQRTNNPAWADDLYQDTFALVLQKIRGGSLQEPEKLAGFIHQVARNLLIRDCRVEKRRGEAGDASLADLISFHRTPLFQLEKKQLAALVRQVLGRVKQERDRLVLYRFYINEEEKGAICDDLGVDPAHFDVILHRARQRFGALWENKRREARS